MEGNHHSLGEPELAASEDTGGRSTRVRSYDCSFCKKGFTNAQALGGHMNIHRRDRARLKQPNHQCQFPFDVSDKAAPSHQPAFEGCASQPLAESHNGGRKYKCPWTSPSERDVSEGRTYIGDPQQLSLFAERPSWQGNRPPGGLSDRQQEITTELDLELRLGPEPTND